MTALLKRNKSKFYCSNCMMEARQEEGQLPIVCGYCGKIFSNWEEIAIEEYKKELEHAPSYLNSAGGN